MSTTDPVQNTHSEENGLDHADCDHNGDHIKQTVQMLNLAVARLEHAMSDGNENVDTLTESFTSLASSIDNMRYAADEMPDSMPHKHAILYHAEAVTAKISTAVMAFQFYDKLSQRLSHISKSLQGLNEIFDNAEHNNPQAWLNLQQMIKSRYTLDSDKAMFDAILQGKSVAEILSTALDNQTADDIELF